MTDLLDNPETRQTLGLLADSGDTVAKAKLSLLLLGSKTPGASDTGRACELLESVCNEDYTVELYRSEADRLKPAAHYGLFLMCDQYWIDAPKAEAAKTHLVTAAELGLAVAQNNLALKYKNGDDGFEKNTELAESLFLKAVEGGFSHSRYFLYLIYSDQNGSLYNLKHAFEQALLSAEDGGDSDMARVAVMYESGKGIDENLIEATKWYFLSACQKKSGKEWVKLKELKEHLSEHEYDEAQGMAMDWIKKNGRLKSDFGRQGIVDPITFGAIDY